jgi:hypothetical protein
MFETFGILNLMFGAYLLFGACYLVLLSGFPGLLPVAGSGDYREREVWYDEI